VDGHTNIDSEQRNEVTCASCSLKLYLSSGKTKPNLLTFLLCDWCESLPGQLKDDQTLILASQDESAVKVTKTLNRADIIPLYSDHQEADTRVFVHCEYIANQSSDINNSSKRIIAFSWDTDVAALCRYHFSQLSIQGHWLHTGTGGNRRFIPVHEAVGPDVWNLLPAMHALTGCDSTSNLNGIGRKGRLTTLKKHKDDPVGLKNLGTDCTVMSDETLTDCFKFISLLLQIWTIPGTSFLPTNTWKAANFPLLKIVHCICQKGQLSMLHLETCPRQETFTSITRWKWLD